MGYKLNAKRPAATPDKRTRNAIESSTVQRATTVRKWCAFARENAIKNRLPLPVAYARGACLRTEPVFAETVQIANAVEA
jgi:hypothetical protein